VDVAEAHTDVAQAEVVRERRHAVQAATRLERDHGAPDVTEETLRDRVVRVGWQTRIAHPLDPLVTLEELRDPCRIGRGCLRSKRERAHPALDEKARERARRLAEGIRL